MSRSHTPTRLLAEFRRRKVPRVGAAYLVTAWIVIEVAETIAPNLGLPSWTVTLVIVFAALGLPVALALAWAFDITPDGVRRTAPLATLPLTRGWASGGLRVAVMAAAVLVLLVGGWIMWGDRSAESNLDDDLVAVLPLRTSGARAELAHLGEGLPELVTASLAAGDGLSAVSMRVLGAALNRHRLRPLEMTEQDARAVARELGAGHLLLGELVGDERQVIVTASLHHVRSGSRRAVLRVEGAADSLHLLTDGLSNQLIAALGGTPQHRLGAITSTSRDALEAYVRGAAAYRRGAYEESVRQLDRALDIDSTFALAALWLGQAGGWTAERPANFARSARLAWNGREQLGAEDRSFLDAWLGPGYPELAAPIAELIATRDRAARAAPDRPELLYLAGDSYTHYGALVGYEDHLDRAAAYFEQAVRIDSAYAGALEHSVQIAVLRGDTAAVRRYSDLALALDSTGSTVEVLRWIRARALDEPTGDSAADVLARIGPALAHDLYWNAMFVELGIAEAGEAIYAAAERVTGPERTIVNSAAFSMAILEGLPERARRFLGAMTSNDARRDVVDLIVTGWWIGDPDAAAAVAARVEVHALTDTPPPAVAALVAGQWYARSGDLDRAHAMLRRLRSVSPETPVEENNRLFAARLLEATLAHATGAADADAKLQLVDGMARAGFRSSFQVRDFVNVELARIWEERGELERAFDAWRRREAFNVDVMRVERLAEEGRLAELLGRHDAAIDAYRHYLQFRARPEGVFLGRTERVRARLDALTGEPARR